MPAHDTGCRLSRASDSIFRGALSRMDMLHTRHGTPQCHLHPPLSGSTNFSPSTWTGVDLA